MAIFLQEDNKDLNKQVFRLSKTGRDKLNTMLTTMDAMGLQNHDGYKMLKHLSDEEYNQGKKKESDKLVKNPNVHTEQDKPKEKETVGVKNKTVEGGIHNNKETNDSITHAFTDWVYGPNGEFTVKHKNMQNLMNHKAEKPFTPKKPKQPQPLQPVKPIKTNTGEIHITNENVTKKIVISEKQIPILYEYRNEPNLPFEEFGDKKYNKQLYEHLVDYLENIGKYGKLTPPSQRFNHIVISNMIMYMPIENFLKIDYASNAQRIIWIIESMLTNIHRDEWINNVDELEIIINKITDDDLDDIDEILSFLTEDGIDTIKEELCGDEGFPDRLIFNDKGLLYVERTIGIGDIMANEDYYNFFNQEYPNVGECWSWAKDGGYDFASMGNCSSYDFWLTLKGWCNPEDVNWEYTIQLNSESLNSEREIRLNHNANVQVDEVICIHTPNKQNEYKWIDGKKIPLKDSILLPA